MHIDCDLLVAWGGVYKKYDKHEYIFHEDEHARFFYQIAEGSVKMFNTNEDGKEFLQGIFYEGQSFGEPPIFINEPYPASSMTLQKSIIIKISIDNFLKMIEENPYLMEKFTRHFARRIYNKAITSREIANNNPEHRIKAFLDSFKKEKSVKNETILIPYTRQEIANFTGLRVETVIRTLLKMHSENKIEISHHKLYY